MLDDMAADSLAPQQDPLEKEIAALEATVSLKERDLEIARIELGALKRAAALRPVAGHKAHRSASDVDSPEDNARHIPHHGGRGKVAGTINMRYREIMKRVVVDGNRFLSPDQWAAAGKECGYDVGVRAIRDWLFRGGGAKAGFVERDGNAYRVSDLAIQRFRLQPPEQQVPTSTSLFADSEVSA